MAYCYLGLKEEPWYGTKYESIPIDEALWNSFRTVTHSDYPELELPQINDMVATEFDILPCPEAIPKDEPRCILKSKPIQLWYKPDNVFQIPKVIMLFQFASGNALAKAIVATHLFVTLVQEQVNNIYRPNPVILPNFGNFYYRSAVILSSFFQ